MSLATAVDLELARATRKFCLRVPAQHGRP